MLYDEGAPEAGINCYIEGGKLYAGAWNTSIWPGTWMASELEPKKWFSAVLVRRDASEKLKDDRFEFYLNGKKTGSCKAAQIKAAWGSDYFLGRSGSTRFHDCKSLGRGRVGHSFAGRMDDLVNYERALSTEELQTIK